MLAVIVGSDPKAKSAERRKLWKGALQDIDPEAVSREAFAALAGTPSLFGEPRAYRLQNIFSSNAEEGLSADAILDMARDLSNSPHTFIFEEEKLLAKPKAALQKAGAEIIETKAVEKKETVNVFAMGDALAQKDRKKLWLLLMQAQKEGIAPENISGVLAWKARALVAGARSTEEKKVYAKLSRDLVVMYHESHRGAGELALLLERFALTL